MEFRKDNPENNLEDIVDQLSKKSELGDPGFWREYLYWSGRCLLFVLFIVVATNIDFRENVSEWFDHISGIEWLILIATSLLVGPALVIGLSYLWGRYRDIFGGSR